MEDELEYTWPKLRTPKSGNRSKTVLWYEWLNSKEFPQDRNAPSRFRAGEGNDVGLRNEQGKSKMIKEISIIIHVVSILLFVAVTLLFIGVSVLTIIEGVTR